MLSADAGCNTIITMTESYLVHLKATMQSSQWLNHTWYISRLQCNHHNDWIIPGTSHRLLARWREECPLQWHQTEDVITTMYKPYKHEHYVDTVLHRYINIIISDSMMVQSQMDPDCFRSVKNLDLVELNRIRYLIYTCIRLLFANFLTLKMLHTCTYCSTTLYIHPMLSVIGCQLLSFFCDNQDLDVY